MTGPAWVVLCVGASVCLFLGLTLGVTVGRSIPWIVCGKCGKTLRIGTSPALQILTVCDDCCAALDTAA